MTVSGYMKPEELAEQLEVQLTTLAKWRRQERGPPFIRAGRQILYARAGVTKWLEVLEKKPQFSAAARSRPGSQSAR